MELDFENSIKEKAPSLEVALIISDVENPPTGANLWNRLEEAAARIKADLSIETVNKRPSILATRKAYKAFGKDPNRYRPSAEALTRRVVKGMDLYRTTAIVDLVNLVSLLTGHSIGAFDAEKISGSKLTLGVGCENEPYEAIGRGPLNISGLPVWRDEIGGIGTPTSDNERTKLSDDTRKLLITVNCYDSQPSAEETAALLVDLLKEYASASNTYIKIYRP